MHRSATDRDIIVQTLMLIESSNKNYELQSFSTHAINNFISWYNDNMNDDVITQLKETIGILGNKIHSISMKILPHHLCCTLHIKQLIMMLIWMLSSKGL